MFTRFRYCFMIAILTLFTVNTMATDYYVLQGAKRGKGTKKRPYKGIYKALKKAIKGDVIHVAEGVYHGKLKVGFITVSGRGITLLGGYNSDFSQRNPWQHLTFIQSPDKKKSQSGDMGLVNVAKDHSNLVLDGFIFDSRTRNVYKEGSLVLDMSARRPPVLLTSPDCIVKNCVFMNSALGACRITGENSIVENCLFMNNVYFSLQVAARGKVTIKNNSFIKTYRQTHTGGDAILIGRECQTVIENNILAFNDGAAISNKLPNPSHVFNNNIFHENGKGSYVFYSSDSKSIIEVEDPEDLEDADLEEAEDNFLVDPEFSFAAKKGEEKLYAPHISFKRGSVYLETGNDEAEEIGVNKDGPFSITKSKANTQEKYSYESISIKQIRTTPKTGKAVTFKAWYSEENRYKFKNAKRVLFLEEITEKNYRCIVLRSIPNYPGSKGEIYGYIERGSKAEQYFTKKIAPKRPSRFTTKNSFTVKGLIHISPRSDKPMLRILELTK
ncbi:right-handed parallel beta-helix repeat-containing protein [Candidatus Uabimicrobium sp. HlEnr_7]|uniref:right-handed parallel beta-helix repeat-containing protein n=1 Tax=Candidatus Uabimicrobium helgolandensis TaxID=3095367 RepID=UPI003556E0C2